MTGARNPTATASDWDPTVPSTYDAGGDTPVEDDPLEDGLPGDQRLMPTGFVEWFVVAQTAIPAMVYLPGSQAIRLPLRIGAYASAFIGLALWWFNRRNDRGVGHPAERWLIFIVFYLLLMIFHPLTSGLLAGIAQTFLYAAVFCAVFWAPGFVTRPAQLVRILAILLVCNGINSMVGVMQVYDPHRWMPSQLSLSLSRLALQAATYVGPNGVLIMRPPGLFDTPGAVCGPGTVAALLGLVFAIGKFAWWKRAIALLFSLAGISAIYLSQVRANFVITIAMMIVYAIALLVQNQKTRLTAFASLCVGVIVVGLTVSTILGGVSIKERFATLLGDDPRGLYLDTRGTQLKNGFNEYVELYPFGAGLARWGMMYGYFGDRSKLESTEIWAEVQPTVWLLDGGIFLLGLYGLALIMTTWSTWRLSMQLTNPHDRLWAATVAAVNIGTLALVFSFVPFVTQVGIQYWFLEGALIGAMARQPRRS